MTKKNRDKKRKRSAAKTDLIKIPLEQQAHAVLSNWTPTISQLTENLNSSLLDLRPLEEEAQTLQSNVQQQRAEYLQELVLRYNRQEKGEQLTLEEKVKAQSQLDNLHEMSEELGDLASEKIQIATQVYDLIDAEIQRLDTAVATLETDYSSETAVLREVSAHKEHAKRLALKGSSESSSSKNIPMASPSDVKYCLCQAPAHGKMLSCDNQTCLVEWFHLSCVGLTRPPAHGKWFCPECCELLGDPNKPKKKRQKS